MLHAPDTGVRGGRLDVVLQWAFWLFVGACLWTWGGYLVFLVLADAFAGLRRDAAWLARGTDRRVRPREGALPFVSVLIAAHDEQAVLRRKLEETLAFDYPADRLEILVGSDGSTDGTDDIVRSFAGRGVRLSAAPRGGKASVLNRLAGLARGELWLFTDANTEIRPDALRLLVRRMADARVGAVCGRLLLRTPAGGDAQEGLYWRYENLLKLYEGRRGTLLGANGGLYLLRRERWRPLDPTTVVDDFVVTMRVLLDGHRVAYDPEAIAAEETAPDLAGEFKRRTRIAAGNFRALRELRPLLWQGSFASFAFWSHKVLRWVAPVLLAGALVVSLLLADTLFWRLVVVAQGSFYLAALLARTRLPWPLDRFAALARYFVEMNAAVLVGLVRHLRGTQRAAWQRTERAGAGGRAA